MLRVIESIRATAADNAAAPAVIGAGHYLSYGDVADKVARISNFFADRKIAPRSKVFLNFTDPDLRLVVVLACLHYGLIPFILMDVEDTSAKVDYDLVIGSLSPHVPHMPFDLVVDQTVLEGRFSDPAWREFPMPGEDDILFIAATGGTTGGKKKLVADRVGQFGEGTVGRRRNDFAFGKRVAFTVGDVTTFGFRRSLRILGHGAAIVRLLPDLVETLKLFNMVRLTQLIATPLDLERFLGTMEVVGICCPSVRDIVVTGSLLHKRLVERLEQRFGNATIEAVYGASEVGMVSKGNITAATFRTGYVGEIADGVKVVGSGSSVQPGPIQLENDSGIFCDYYSGGEITRVSQSLYTMPDLGYLEGHSLYLVGRDDEVFNLSGNKVPYSVIEAAVREAPGVADVGVVGAATADDPLGVLIAFVGDDTVNVTDLADRRLRGPQAAIGKRTRIFLPDRCHRSQHDGQDGPTGDASVLCGAQGVADAHPGHGGNMRNVKRLAWAAALIVAAATAASAASADWTAGGGDRWQALLTAAQHEGGMAASLCQPSLAEPLRRAFKADTGLDISFITGSPGDLNRRFGAEVESGRVTIDVALTGANTVTLPRDRLDSDCRLSRAARRHGPTKMAGRSPPLGRRRRTLHCSPGCICLRSAADQSGRRSTPPA